MAVRVERIEVPPRARDSLAPSSEARLLRSSKPAPRWRTFTSGLGLGVFVVSIAGLLHYASHTGNSAPTIDTWNEAWLHSPLADDPGSSARAVVGEGTPTVETTREAGEETGEETGEIVEEMGGIVEELDELGAPVELIHAKIPARVQKSTGVRLSEGLPCEINVRLSADTTRGASSFARAGSPHAGSELHSLDVDCAGETLYDSLAHPESSAGRDATLYEVAGRAPNTFAYRLIYSDVGGQLGRRLIELDTFEMKARVFTESAPAFHVELRIGLETLTREGDSLLGLPRGVYKLTRELRRTSAAGELPWPVAEPCVFDAHLVMASSEGLFCKATLSCSGRTLYGVRNSIGPCTVEDRRVVGFHDLLHSSEDQSPALSFDLGTGVVQVEDSTDERGHYRVRFERAY